jgi:hypothetical protein
MAYLSTGSRAFLDCIEMSRRHKSPHARVDLYLPLYPLSVTSIKDLYVDRGYALLDCLLDEDVSVELARLPLLDLWELPDLLLLTGSAFWRLRDWYLIIFDEFYIYNS